MAKVAELVAEMSLNTARLQADVGKATAIMSRGVKSMESAFAGLRSSILAAVSVGSIVQLGKTALELGDNLSKASKKFGIAVEDLSALKYAAALADVSFEDLGTALKKMSVAVTGAVVPTSDMGIAFRAMGISVKDAAGNMKSTDVLFGEIADKFKGFKDGAEKTALAVAIFGRSGANIIPILNEGKDGLAKMKEEAKGLGAVMSGENAKRLEEYNDTIKKIGIAAKSTAAGIIADLGGAIENLGKTINKESPRIEKFFAKVFGGKTSAELAVAAGTTQAPGEPKPVDKKTNAPNIEAIKKDMELREKAFKSWASGRTEGMEAFYGTDKTTFDETFNAEKEAFDNRQKIFEKTKEYAEELKGTMDALNVPDFEAELADAMPALDALIAKQQAMTPEDKFSEALRYGDSASAITLMNEGLAEQMRLTDEASAKSAAFYDVWREANISMSMAAVNIGMSIRDGLVNTLTDVITGAKSVGEAFAALGKAILKMLVETLVKWIVNRTIMAAMGKAFMAAETAATVAFGTVAASSLAPAAAFMEIITLGGATAPAVAGLATTVGFAETLAIPMLEKGGIVNKPTLVMAGEKGPEAIVPLDEGGGGQTIQLILDGQVLAEWFDKKAKRYGFVRLVPA